MQVQRILLLQDRFGRRHLVARIAKGELLSLGRQPAAICVPPLHLEFLIVVRRCGSVLCVVRILIVSIIEIEVVVQGQITAAGSLRQHRSRSAPTRTTSVDPDAAYRI